MKFVFVQDQTRVTFDSKKLTYHVKVERGPGIYDTIRGSLTLTEMDAHMANFRKDGVEPRIYP